MSNPTTRTSARSSAEFSAELVPDPLLDRLSAGLSVTCLLVGIALILAVDIAVVEQAGAVLAWTLYLVAALRRQRLCRLRIYANGDVHLQRVDGQWFDGRVAAGSLFLARIAWLRVEGRMPYRGWFIPCDEAPDEWRRLRVISRHFADI